jgi:hypothetical protein
MTDSKVVKIYTINGSPLLASFRYTGCFILSYVITKIYNNKTKGPTLMELFTATGKLKKFLFFDN